MSGDPLEFSAQEFFTELTAIAIKNRLELAIIAQITTARNFMSFEFARWRTHMLRVTERHPVPAAP